MKATLYIPERYPRELWLAVYDDSGCQILHMGMLYTSDKLKPIDVYFQRGAFDDMGSVMHEGQFREPEFLRELSGILDRVMNS